MEELEVLKRKRQLRDGGKNKKELRASYNISCVKYDISKESRARFHRSDEWSLMRSWAWKNIPGNCACCGSDKNIHIDHIVPLTVNPKRSLQYTNLQKLCASCNIFKSNKGTTRFNREFKPESVPDYILNMKARWEIFFKRKHKVRYRVLRSGKVVVGNKKKAACKKAKT